MTILKAPLRIVKEYGLPSNRVIFICSCSSGVAFYIRCLEDGVMYRIEGNADMIDSWDEVT